MDAYFVIGNPIAHSKSPQIHARFADLTGQQLSYERLRVELGRFEPTVAELIARGVKGCNVTVPFKLEAFELAHEASARAQLALAANTLKFEGGRILADNTDGLGLVRDIEVNAGQPLRGLDVLLLGGGGATAGVLGPLLLAGPRRVVVANRTQAKAEAIAQRHRQHPSLRQALQHTELQVLPLDDRLPASDIVINATSSSLAGAGVLIAPTALRSGALVYDMMYGPAAEAFLQWAVQHGARRRDGLGMLVEQAAEAFFLWRGVRPPAQELLEEMRQP
jgi:shikimate dehydrogenase